MSTQRESSREAVFAGSVRRRREDKGWTQTDLAREMKKQGFSFHQQTIQRIEDGKRPVRLDEAYALAELLGSKIDFMSESMEGWRKREVFNLVWGVVTLPSNVNKGVDEMFNDASDMAEHVGYELEQGHRTDRVLAGLAMLEELVRMADNLPKATKVLVGPFADIIDRIFEEFQDDDDAPSDADHLVTADERKVRELVKKHRAPVRFKKMSLVELAEVYSPGYFEED